MKFNTARACSSGSERTSAKILSAMVIQILTRLFWRSIETTNGEFNNGLDLFAIKSTKPLQDVVDVGARFKIFKDR
jgi:hypothetical protein